MVVFLRLDAYLANETCRGMCLAGHTLWSIKMKGEFRSIEVEQEYGIWILPVLIYGFVKVNMFDVVLNLKREDFAPSSSM